MEEQNAVHAEVFKAAASMPANDGQHLLLKLETQAAMPGANVERVYAVPTDKVPQLIAAAALGMPKPPKSWSDGEQVPVFGVSWWELRKVVDSDAFILLLTLETGGTLSFVLNGTMTAAIQETLSTFLGAAPNAPDASLQ